jgi:hypothetical protein
MPYNQLLRLEWKKAGYERRVGSDAVAVPAPRGFIRAYHLSSAQHAISNIKSARLKVARFSDLNDPFELLSLNFKEKGIRNLVRSAKRKYDSHTGLLCFSADWTNPLMWSHYANKHRGICLGFDLRNDLVQRVRYEDERIRIAIGDNGELSKLDDELEKLVLCTKFRDWQYEEECRIFVSLSSCQSEGSLHFYPFGDDVCLREVILGPECLEKLDTARELVKTRFPTAIVFKARLAFKFFKVVADERSVP